MNLDEIEIGKEYKVDGLGVSGYYLVKSFLKQKNGKILVEAKSKKEAHNRILDPETFSNVKKGQETVEPLVIKDQTLLASLNNGYEIYELEVDSLPVPKRSRRS